LERDTRLALEVPDLLLVAGDLGEPQELAVPAEPDWAALRRAGPADRGDVRQRGRRQQVGGRCGNDVTHRRGLPPRQPQKELFLASCES
jgi:hypothetical protein